LTSKLAGDFVEWRQPRFPKLGDHAVSPLDFSRETVLPSRYVQGDERYVSTEKLASGVIDHMKAAIDPSFYVAGFQSVKANVSG
jgi:hypothetical protein